MIAARPCRRAPSPQSGEAERKLALTEVLLGCDDPEECAQRAVDWLGEEVGARVLCAMVSSDGARLSGVAAHGLSPRRARAFAIDLLEPGDHPLTEALGARRTLSFPASLDGSAPFGGMPFQAAPLHSTGTRGAALGLLLAAGLPEGASRILRWLGDLLGHTLGRLASLRRLVDAERRLASERALLDRILDALPDPILLTDTEGRMRRANARARNLLVAGERDSEGRRRAVELNNMLFSAALSQRAIDGAATARRELPLVNPTEGSDLLFELLTVGGEPREAAGLVSILRNVTDLQRASAEIEENYRKLRIAEAHVRAERDRLDLIIDSVADPILVTDPMDNVVLMNTPAERLFASRAAERPEAERAVRANDAHFSSFIANLFFTGQEMVRRGELQLVDPASGAAVPVEAIAGKILSARGEVTAVVTILHDRSEAIEKARLYEQLQAGSRELEERIRAATAELVRRNELLQRQHIELEQASALKSQFLASVSHEFRTPLNAILGYTSLLLREVSGAVSPSQRRSLQRVDSNARHLLALISDILDIARIEAGRMVLRVSAFRIDQLVAEAMAEIEPIVDRAKLAVERRIDPDLPSLRSDRQKVKQILVNLLTNALKFTPEGSIRISAEHLVESGELALAVADTGVGIARADRERVFEDFRQAEPVASHELRSTGLGLAICRRLAGVLGGRITLASRKGVGSTFTLILPRRPPRRESGGAR